MQLSLPINEKLESFVLCAAINSQHASLEIIEQCSEDDFFSPRNKIIFSCLKSLCNSGIFITLQALIFEISKQDKKSEVDQQYVAGLAFEYWSGLPYEQYVKDLRKISLLRKMIYSSQEMMKSCAEENADPEKILSAHEESILKAQGLASKSIISSAEISLNFKKGKSCIQDLKWRTQRYLMGEKTYEGVSSGYPRLDSALGSFQNGMLYSIGARTSMGKTTFMLNLIKNMVSKHRVGLFSLEMSAQILYSKLMCIEAGIRYRDFFDGKVLPKDFERFCILEEQFSKFPLFIDDEGNLNTQKLVARAKRLKNSKKIEILFIDYLTRIKCCGKYFSKHLEIDEITKCLQALAKTLDIPIVLLAQLNRQSISATKSRPSMIDFKESGSVEEDSDACILLHRPEYYDKNDKPGVMEVIIDKNRIMGTRTMIQFHCESEKSERYEESKPVEKIKEEEPESKRESITFRALCSKIEEED